MPINRTCKHKILWIAGKDYQHFVPTKGKRGPKSKTPRGSAKRDFKNSQKSSLSSRFGIQIVYLGLTWWRQSSQFGQICVKGQAPPHPKPSPVGRGWPKRRRSRRTGEGSVANRTALLRRSEVAGYDEASSQPSIDS